MARLKKILLVDDDQAVRDLLTVSFKAERYEVMKAGNGKDGLFALDMDPSGIDLILCDIMMEQMDGFEFIKVVKSNSLWKSIPFIFLSAKSDLQSRIIGIQAGADDYIMKPFQKDEVVTKIKSYIEKVHELKNRITITGLRGEIAETSLKELFRIISITKKTGILTVGNRYVAGAFYFVRGALINAAKEDNFSIACHKWGEDAAKELMEIAAGNFNFEPQAALNVPSVFPPAFIDKLITNQ